MISDETKSFLTSKTIWGALLTVVGAVMSMFHLDVSGLAGLEGDLVTFVGSGLAIYGRVAAVKKIG